MKPLALLALVAVSVTYSQISDKILSVKTGEVNEGQPLTVEAELVGTIRINQLLLAYRPFGSSEYRQVEMQVVGNTARATIPADQVIPLEMEYYFILRIEGQELEETHPMENPQERPFRVQVRPRSARDEEIIFLSPEEGTTVTSDELLISVSLFRARPIVNRGATKVYINDRNVTEFSVIAEELITLVPENVSPPLTSGPQLVRVELYDTSGNLYHTKSMSFRQVTPAEAEELRTLLTYNVAATLEARNENVQQVSTSYNRGNLTASSQYGILRVNGRLYVTNEEKDDRQPQNRYFIEGQTPWLRIGYGDAYPTFPSLIMSGKRIRGLTGSLTLGFFNVDYAQGEVVRKVDGDTLRTLFLKDVPTTGGSYAPYDTVGGPDSLDRWAEFRYGTFTRDLLAVRPSFGSGKSFQWGFSFLKAKDDIGSLRRNPNASFPEGVLYGIRPQENVAVGSDLLIAFDERRVEFTAQGGASLYNQDITGGNISDETIDTLMFKGDADSTKKREDLKRIKRQVSQFITVNQNLVPLGITKIPSILAYEGALSLNYFNNYVKVSYIFRGSQYNSFGQTFIRKDVKGVNIFDRLRLLESQLFLSVGYERLQDNTDNSKQTTTTFTNLNTSVSYFPRGNFPDVTVGYGQNSNSNGVPSTPDTSLIAINDVTNRIFVQLGYAFTAGLRHHASLSVSSAVRDDQTRRNTDTKSMTVSGAATTTWKIPLETFVSITLNLNDLPVLPQPLDPVDSVRYTLSPFNYTTIQLGGRYRMLEDKLRLWASLSPTFGDVARTTFDVGGEYFFYQNLSAFLQASLLKNPGVTDFIWSLMLKYNL